MKIRLYNHVTDKEMVIRLWKAVFAYDTPHNDPLVSINRKLKHHDNLFFVAEDDDSSIAGTVMAGYDGHRGWIYSLAVAPAARKKGIGSLLLKHAERELGKLDCPKINLQVMPANSEVVKFYEKNGYQVEARISMGKKL